MFLMYGISSRNCVGEVGFVRDCAKFLDGGHVHFFVSELLIMMDISSWKPKHDQKYACMFRRQFRVVPRGFSPLSIGDQWRYR